MPTRSLFYSPKTDSSVSQRCSSCFPLFKLFFNFSQRQIHLSPSVVQVVSLCPSCFSTSPKDRFICLTKLFKLSPLFKLFFNFSPRQIHLSPNVVQVVSLCPKLFFNFSQRQIHLSDKVVQVVPVVQVVFLIFPTDRFICLKVVL